LIHIFVDDSGALHDPLESVVTVAAVMTDQPARLQWLVRRIRRSVKRKPSQNFPAEFKFYNLPAIHPFENNRR